MVDTFAVSGLETDTLHATLAYKDVNSDNFAEIFKEAVRDIEEGGWPSSVL